jgi:hypothetical protein
VEENFYIFHYEHFSANRRYLANNGNILWKGNLYSDGQQFHQCHIDLNSLNTAKTMTYDVGNPDPGLGEEHKCSIN